MDDLMRELAGFLYSHGATEEKLPVTPLIFVDMTGGNFLCAIMLGRIVYWSWPKRGQPALDAETGGIKGKLTVFRDGHWWMARTRTEWYEEVHANHNQINHALRKLERQGLVATRRYKFRGVPTTHVRLLPERFWAAYEAACRTNKNDLGEQPG